MFRWLAAGEHALCYSGSGQHACAHEEGVDGAGGAAAFVDGPDDEGLSAAGVPGGENSRNARGVLPVFRFDVGTRILVYL